MNALHPDKIRGRGGPPVRSGAEPSRKIGKGETPPSGRPVPARRGREYVFIAPKPRFRLRNGRRLGCRHSLIALCHKRIRVHGQFIEFVNRSRGALFGPCCVTSIVAAPATAISRSPTDQRSDAHPSGKRKGQHRDGDGLKLHNPADRDPGRLPGCS